MIISGVSALMRSINTELVILLGLYVLVGGVFMIWPHLDLQAAAWFYDPATKTFPAKQQLFFQVLTKGLTPLLLLFAGWTAWISWQHHNWRPLVYMLACLAIGPGLVVNALFKDHWDRARPRQIEQFGGDKRFTPVLQPSDQCVRNCSFPSGDASGGFVVFAFAFLATTARGRRYWLLAATATGLLFGYSRMALGAHFLSDVLFAGLIVYSCCWAIASLKVFQRSRCDRGFFGYASE